MFPKVPINGIGLSVGFQINGQLRDFFTTGTQIQHTAWKNQSMFGPSTTCQQKTRAHNCQKNTTAESKLSSISLLPDSAAHKKEHWAKPGEKTPVNSRLSTEPQWQIERWHSQLKLSKDDCGGTAEGLAWFLLRVHSSENRALNTSQVNKLVGHPWANSEQSCICSLRSRLSCKANLNSILFKCNILIRFFRFTEDIKNEQKSLQWIWEFKYLFAAHLKEETYENAP